MTETTARQEPIQLDYDDVTRRQAKVTGPHHARFALIEQQAAWVCKHADDIDRFRRRFCEFLGHVSLWCEEHQRDVQAGFISVGEGGVTTFVVTRGDDYRYDLDDMITDLDLEIARTFDEIVGDVIQLPQRAADDLASFFTITDAIQAWPPKPPTNTRQNTTGPS